MPFVKNFRRAIDVGGHCGLWSRPMAAMFSRVYAFEPIELHRACFEANIHPESIDGPGANVTLYPFALGNHADTVYLHTGPSSSGDTFVKEDGEHTAEMITLDDFADAEMAPLDLDFIKLDCEGYEFYALKGGEKTIKRWRPTVIVEQKPGKGRQFGLGDHDAVALLKSWGAEVVKEISGDFIMRWK
jgi:FkbM family methyltransferase